MYTPGPAMSFFTWWSLFLQNVQDASTAWPATSVSDIRTSWGWRRMFRRADEYDSPVDAARALTRRLRCFLVVIRPPALRSNAPSGLFGYGVGTAVRGH